MTDGFNARTPAGTRPLGCADYAGDATLGAVAGFGDEFLGKG